MNDYYKYIGWPGRIQSVQGISYKWLIQILLSAYIKLFLSFLWFNPCLTFAGKATIVCNRESLMKGKDQSLY